MRTCGNGVLPSDNKQTAANMRVLMVAALFVSTDSCCSGVAGTSTSNFLNMAIDPNAAAGSAIVVTNSATQTSGQLVKITGVSGQIALKVAAGTTQLQQVEVVGSLQANNGVDNTAIGTNTPSTGAFTTLSASNGLDSTAIGANTASTGTFTDLTVTGACTGCGGGSSGYTQYATAGATATFSPGDKWEAGKLYQSSAISIASVTSSMVCSVSPAASLISAGDSRAHSLYCYVSSNGNVKVVLAIGKNDIDEGNGANKIGDGFSVNILVTATS